MLSSEFWYMVRNLKNVNCLTSLCRVLPFQECLHPTRFCEYIAGPGESILISREIKRKSGENNNKSPNETKISSSRLSKKYPARSTVPLHSAGRDRVMGIFRTVIESAICRYSCFLAGAAGKAKRLSFDELGCWPVKCKTVKRNAALPCSATKEEKPLCQPYSFACRCYAYCEVSCAAGTSR